MANTEKILALSVIAVDGASGTINRVEGSLNRLGIKAGTTDDAMRSLTKSFIGIGSVVVASVAVEKFTSFLGDSVKAAIEEEAGIKRLTTALQANVPSRQADMKTIEETIKGREALAFADDELRDSLARLSGATHDVGEAFHIQSIAMDLARFKNISLADATEELIRVHAGNYRSLKALGIEIDAHATRTEALGRVQAIVAGQARGFGETTAGAMQAAGVAVHDLQEEIGGKLSPAVRDLAKWLRRDLIPAIEALAPAADGASKLFADMAAVMGISSQRIRQRVLDQKDALEAALYAAEKYQNTIHTGIPPVYAFAGAAAVLKESVVAGSDAFRSFTTDAGETGAGLDNVGARARMAALGFDVLANSAYNAAAAEALAAQQRLGAGKFRTGGPSGDIAGAMGGMPGFENLGQDAALFTANARQHTADVAAAERAAEAAAKRRGRSGASAARAAAAAAETAEHKLTVAAYEQAQKAGDTYYDTLHEKNKRAIDDAHKLAQTQIENAHKAAAKAIEDAHKVANEQISAARKSVDAQLREQQRLNAAPVTAAEQALRATQNAQQFRDLTEALQAAEQGGDPKAIRAAQEQLANFQAQTAIDSMREQQALADEAAQKAADAANAQLDTQQKTEDATYEAQKAAEEATYQARLADEDARYAIKVHDEDERWKRQKAKFDEHIKAMEESKKATAKLAEAETKRFLQEQLKLAHEFGTAQDMKYAQQDLDAFLRSIGHHASGGWVGTNGPELGIVGESGPEYIVPNGGRMGGFHWSGDININGSDKSPREIAREVTYEIQRLMTRNGQTSLAAR